MGSAVTQPSREAEKNRKKIHVKLPVLPSSCSKIVLAAAPALPEPQGFA
jgi:hypothetical protein